MEASGNITSSTPVTAAGSEDEAALWREFKAGGSDEARQKLFDLHYVFARQVAAKHYLDRKRGDIEFSDLCQLGCTGLLDALDRYDPARGVPFRPYARSRISGCILDGLDRMSEMREQLAFKRRARRERLKSLSVEAPETLDAAEAMLALVEMATGLAIGLMIEGIGLYITQNEADHRTSPYDSLVWKDLIRSLRAEIPNLSDQEEKIIRYHYLDGLSFEQIASVLGLSKGRISQIHKSALKSLRHRISPDTAFRLQK